MQSICSQLRLASPHAVREAVASSAQTRYKGFGCVAAAFPFEPEPMNSWIPDLAATDKPHYLAIADVIAADVRSGRLCAGDRLPPQRKLASRLALDFTTVARGYAEAQQRGLIESRVGQGTYRARASRARAPRGAAAPRRPRRSLDEPAARARRSRPVARMQAGLAEVGRDLVALLRYQGFGGAPADKDAASAWLGRRALVPTQDRIFVSPGAHPALLGIFGILAQAGETILCEAITYPGARSIAAQLGLAAVGLPMDGDGDRSRRARRCLRGTRRRRSISTRRCRTRRRSRSPTRRRARDRGGRAPLTACRSSRTTPTASSPTHGRAPFAAIAPDI